MAALAALRFVWVWTSLKLTLYRKRGPNAPPKVGLRLVAVMSLAGVRGAITLAGILTLPFLMQDGSPLPARNLAIFLAAGVIIVSLVVATVALPRLLKGVVLPPEPSHLEEEDRSRVAAASAALRAIEDAQHAMAEGKADPDLYAEAGTRLMEVYRRRIEKQGLQGEAVSHLRKLEEIERQLRLAGIRAERDVYYELSRSRELSDEISRRLIREADLSEARLTGS